MPQGQSTGSVELTSQRVSNLATHNHGAFGRKESTTFFKFSNCQRFLLEGILTGSVYQKKQRAVFLLSEKSFTSLCQSELQAFDARIEAFKAVDTVVVGCSTDTSDVHKAFMNVPQSEGGIAGIQYPLVFDANKTISTNYDVLSGDYDYEDEGLLSADSDMVALRGLFLIDKTGVVQHQLINF